MTKKKLSSLSIFFPCYNDQHTIGNLVVDAYRIGKRVAKEIEVIVVDDGSSDNSRQLLNKLQKKYPKLKLVFHKKNKGYGGALRSGFKNATKEFVFYTDGDGQYSLQDLPKLVRAVNEKVDVVNGIKIARHDSLGRIIAGDIYYLWVRLLFRTPIKEIDTDYRLVRKKFIDKISLKMNSGSICVELVKKLALAGARFKEIPVHHYPRQFGNSQFFQITRVVKTLTDDLELYWWMRRR